MVFIKNQAMLIAYTLVVQWFGLSTFTARA